MCAIFLRYLCRSESIGINIVVLQCRYVEKIFSASFLCLHIMVILIKQWLQTFLGNSVLLFYVIYCTVHWSILRHRYRLLTIFHLEHRTLILACNRNICGQIQSSFSPSQAAFNETADGELVWPVCFCRCTTIRQHQEYKYISNYQLLIFHGRKQDNPAYKCQCLGWLYKIAHNQVVYLIISFY